MIDAVFIDRDGTLIYDEGFTHKVEDLKFYERTIAGLHLLDPKTKIIIITSQPGIARGLYTKDDYFKFRDNMHEKLKDEGIIVTSEYFCPHHPKYGNPPVECDCRKPKPGLFERALKEHDLKAENCWNVGDKRSDIAAGQACGIKSILVKTGCGGEGGEGCEVKPEYVAQDLYDAVQYMVIQ